MDWLGLVTMGCSHGTKTDMRELNWGSSFVDYKPAHSWWFAHKGVRWSSVASKSFTSCSSVHPASPLRSCRFRPPYYIVFKRNTPYDNVSIDASKRDNPRPIPIFQRTYVGRKRSELVRIAGHCSRPRYSRHRVLLHHARSTSFRCSSAFTPTSVFDILGGQSWSSPSLDTVHHDSKSISIISVSLAWSRQAQKKDPARAQLD